MKADLYSALTGSSAVTALVGTRIYVNTVPEHVALPCIAIRRSGTQFETTIHNGVPIARITQGYVFVMGEAQRDVDPVAEAVIAAAGAAGFYPTDLSDELPDGDDLSIAAAVMQFNFYQ